ncbi:SHOCT domain-containing protein [Haloarchaeobius sp. DFWS5]|uniref:SHOCT domain-containing protein n=1 Tax=Haloarchaeobius sp. DFWS5 TaxID=3446114 RepID=UPI003EC0FA5E
MSSSNQLDTTTIILLILGALILLPVLMMAVGFGGVMGYGGMMGGYETTNGWWPLVGMLVPLVFLLLLLGGGYFLVRHATESHSAQNPAMEELRMAYARGDLTDEEFEVRREKLKRSE